LLGALNRELGVSHNLLNGRFGCKEALTVNDVTYEEICRWE
jgi:hypothetical protein